MRTIIKFYEEKNNNIVINFLQNNICNIHLLVFMVKKGLLIVSRFLIW